MDNPFKFGVLVDGEFFTDRVDEVKQVQLYVKPEDNACYYVINNKTTGKVEDVFDLNLVPDGYGGKLFDVALFMPMDYNTHGDPKYNPYQNHLHH